MSEKLGVGYIGLGDHCTQSHAPFLEQITSCELVGVADPREVDLGLLNLVEQPTVTKNYHELLEDVRVEVVVITTGDALHFRIANDALHAGKHVLVEKPAAATVEELAALSGLLDYADEQKLRFWVCHPREFGDGPWRKAAQLIGNPSKISEAFNAGPMGELEEIRYDCHYTVPSKRGIHTSFADDKMNHTIVSVMQALPSTLGFRDAVLLDNSPTSYDARFVTIDKEAQRKGVLIKASGRRSAHSEHHSGGVYRDWIEAIFEEGVLRVEPSLGRIALTYGYEEKSPFQFDTSVLYENMFGTFNNEFVLSALDSNRPESLTRKVKLLGTAAAILMQQPGFRGEITEESVRGLTI